MPLHKGKENGQCFWQYGEHGAKYTFPCSAGEKPDL